jgi:hypothetical protein
MGGGTATGSFTYDKTAPLLATDVRGLAPNATYTPRWRDLRCW